MSEHEVSARDFGRLESDVLALKVQNTELKLEIRELRADVRTLLDAVTEAKGGWKMLMAVGSASAIIGATMSKLVLWLKGAL